MEERCGPAHDLHGLPDVGNNAESTYSNPLTNGCCVGCKADFEGDPLTNACRQACDANLEGNLCDSPLHRPHKRARRDEVQIDAYAAGPTLEEASFAALPPTAPRANHKRRRRACCYSG